MPDMALDEPCPSPDKPLFLCSHTVAEHEAHRVIAFGRFIGIEMAEWQQRVIFGLYAGQIGVRGRRNGMAAIEHAILGYEADQRTALHRVEVIAAHRTTSS